MRVCFAGILCAALFGSVAHGADNWPQFRGPDGQGHTDAVDLPTKWSETENIVWKVPVAGRGWSSPVIQGNQIWMTTAIDDGHVLRAICLDRVNGGYCATSTSLKLPSPNTSTPRTATPLHRRSSKGTGCGCTSARPAPPVSIRAAATSCGEISSSKSTTRKGRAARRPWSAISWL